MINFTYSAEKCNKCANYLWRGTLLTNASWGFLHPDYLIRYMCVWCKELYFHNRVKGFEIQEEAMPNYMSYYRQLLLEEYTTGNMMKRSQIAAKLLGSKENKKL